MSTNLLATLASKYGLSPVALRAMLRDFRSAALLEPVEYRCGVHDFGVFYTATTKESYKLYDSTVYKVPSRTVLKLRPEKATTVEMDECADVRLACFHVYTADLEYRFDSASKAAQFTLQLPVSRQGETWKLHRHKYEGYDTFLFAKSGVSDADLKAIDVPIFNASDEWIGARLMPNCESWWSSVNTIGYSISRPECAAETDGALVTEVGTTDEGRQALAHFKSRALNF